MRYYSHIIFLLLLFVSVKVVAQDKVFLRNGKVIPCKIEAISEKTISYHDTVPNSALITLSKNDVLMTEYGKSESIYLFSKEQPAFTIQKNTTDQHETNHFNKGK